MIDWEAQWKDFSPNFYDGKAHIDLTPQGTLVLEPGEGFGDLSHPTTRLMLELMKPLAANQVVLDIGCGSGILTLAALILGADRAHGIDIEKGALMHAKKNAKLNLQKAQFSKKANSKIPYSLVLMNMIFSEQKVAFKKSDFSQNFQHLITSGILLQEKERYLAWCTQMGWHLLQEKGEGEWLGFVFTSEDTCK